MVGQGLPRRAQHGFTVTELMVVVAIVGIIAAIAAPDMAEMVRRQRVKTASFDIFAGITAARSEAIKRNLVVQVTPVSGSWVNGFTITDSNDRLVRTQSGWQAMTMNGPDFLRFNSAGRLASAGGGPARISITAADVYGDYGKRCVTVEPTGRAHSKEGACT